MLRLHFVFLHVPQLAHGRGWRVRDGEGLQVFDEVLLAFFTAISSLDLLITMRFPRPVSPEHRVNSCRRSPRCGTRGEGTSARARERCTNARCTS